MYDYHTHTWFSEDSEAPIENMIEKAISLGIKEIAITDHLDLDYPSSDFTFDLDLEPYNEKIDEMKSKYKSHIRVVKGIEMGLQKHVLQDSAEIADAYDFDFILGSFHAADKKDLYMDYFTDKEPISGYREFYTTVYECLKEYKNYNVVGHLNVIDRYTNDIPSWDIYEDIIIEILNMVIADGKGIEFNTSIYRYKNYENYVTILKLYKKLGGEILTIGSDAHGPSTLCGHFHETYELIKDAGFKYITVYDQLKPDFIKI